jgi:pyrimidine operon attenuation protein/uracil phosphoribosyltransferase
MASDLVARAADQRLVVVGIQRRGAELADRLAPMLAEATGASPARGVLDITLYRDDLSTIGPSPVVHETRLPQTLDGTTVVLVDDVLHTGRTIRAALNELIDFGRPRRILLAVLIDRGGHELPIAADVVGLRVAVEPGDHIEVRVAERDGVDQVDRHSGAAT